MSTRRIPIAFLAGGLLLKGSLALLWNFVKSPVVSTLLTTSDPGALWLATRTTEVIFGVSNARKEIPAPAEPAIFVLLLIVGFGLECLMIGFVVQRAWRQKRALVTPEETLTAERAP
jgi:hypothetical protein